MALTYSRVKVLLILKTMRTNIVRQEKDLNQYIEFIKIKPDDPYYEKRLIEAMGELKAHRHLYELMCLEFDIAENEIASSM
ncbi:hypothetical protein YDYSY3_60530 [Paenibacillus chitinolyticus]|uniref:hypothetical protein n=1 Tax=Paenibacillus chitinolyticus TaxID=79263 RepID=UPI0026E4A98E|nr:hypothetical protein [Paenibacillus chitinolyticus]GKS15053.1 hypothetical protein YDYSY3_60530 [Paenibacillus chitinolyticus]